MTNSKKNNGFVIKPISPLIGSSIYGLDLSAPIEKETLEKLRNVWLQRKVLVFTDQNLSPEQHINFTLQFGELDKYPFLKGLKGYPLITEVLKLPNEKINFGGVWHSDTTYLTEPAIGASLYALELPPVGGDTIFCDMCAAYLTLPNDIKNEIAQLRAINSSAKDKVSQTRSNRVSSSEDAKKIFSSIHPVVRTHPETGEKLLYVNEAHTVQFEGWSIEKSQPLLNTLFQHARKPEFQCRIQWQLGTLVLWDNRSSHHYPINDYTGHRRLLHRVSLKGDKPY